MCPECWLVGSRRRRRPERRELALPCQAGDIDGAVVIAAPHHAHGVSGQDALFISDDPFTDLVGARRLGLGTVMVLSGKYLC